MKKVLTIMLCIYLGIGIIAVVYVLNNQKNLNGPQGSTEINTESVFEKDKEYPSDIRKDKTPVQKETESDEELEYDFESEKAEFVPFDDV